MGTETIGTFEKAPVTSVNQGSTGKTRGESMRESMSAMHREKRDWEGCVLAGGLAIKAKCHACSGDFILRLSPANQSALGAADVSVRDLACVGIGCQRTDMMSG